MTTLLRILATHVAAGLLGGFCGYQYVMLSHRLDLLEGDADMTHRPHPRALWVAVLLSCVAVIGIGALGLVQQRQHTDDVTRNQVAAEQTQHQLDDFRACINRYSRVQATAQAVRGRAAARLDRAQQKVADDEAILWQYVAQSLGGKPVPHKVAARILTAYLAAAAHEQQVLHDLAAAREAHPYPQPPTIACPQAAR